MSRTEGDRTRRPARRARRAMLAVAVLGAALLSPIGARTDATPASDGNPDLDPSCGIDITLVLDDSGSINSTEAQAVRDGAQAFASALAGTPSRLKTVVFATTAYGIGAGGGQTFDPDAVVFRNPASYVAPTSGAGLGGTNWDDALEVVRRSSEGPGDLVVFLTDGDPTFRNTVTPDGHLDDGSQSISGTGNSTSAADLSQAVTEANLLKAAGAHMFGVGVGFTSASSEQRLNDVTGDEELTITGGVPTPTFGEADYIVPATFGDLEEVVSAFVRELCGHTLNITKYLQQADGTTVKAGAADPWEFTATLTPPPDSWQNPPGVVGATGSLTSNGSGGVSFVWDQGSNDHSHLADVVETAQPGWVYNGATCSVNDFSGNPPTVLFDTVGGNTPGSSGDPADLNDLPVQSGKAVNCSVYNREIRSSTISVAKVTSPAGQPGDFDFTLSQGATTIDTLDDLSHGESGAFDPVAPGTYTVAEAAAPGYSTSAACDNLATPATETVAPSGLVVGEAQSWRCTFTNTALPGSITVVKQSVGADGTFPFTSNVPGLGNFSLTTSGGTASSATVPVPVGHYNVAETVPPQWTQTGASCTGGDPPSDIVVGPGENVTCTFTNTAPAPSIRVVKTASPGSVNELGGPVTYTVTVVNTSVEPVEVTSLTDSIDGGPDLDLTSTGGPITATTCNTLVGSTLAAGASGSCTFVAQVSGLGNTTEVDEVTATAEDSDANEATASDDASVAIVGVLPAIEVTKTPSVPTLVEPGGPVTYTVSVRNDGLEPVTINTLTDTMESDPPVDITVIGGPITATTCNTLVGAVVPVGETRTCTYTYLHTGHSADVPDGFVDDTVTVTGSDDDGTVTDTADAQVALLDAPPAVTVAKTANPTSIVETAPGQTRTVTYNVSITNDAPEAGEVVSITDSVEGAPPVAVTGTCDDLVGTWLDPGETVTCAFTMPVSGDAGDVIDDTVRVTLRDNEGGTAFDDDPAAVTVTNAPSSLLVTKSASPTSVPELGGPVNYTVTVRNTSASDAVTIGSITDAVGAGTPFPLNGSCGALVGQTLQPDQQVSCTFTLPVTGNAGVTVTDVVNVVGTDDDGATVSDDDDAAVTITDRPSSITVQKVADVASLPEPGGTVTYTVTITNTSVADAVTIDSIVDSVNGAPATAVAGTCDDLVGTTLAPSTSRTCTFTANVGTHAGDVTADTVTVDGTDDDGVPVSASGSDSVTITDVAASLEVVKEAAEASVPEPGGPVSFTVTIRNTSEVDSVVIDSITDAVGANPPAAVDGTCDDLLGTVLDPGDEVQCEFTANVAGNAGDVVHDTVVVDGTDDDENAVSAQDSEDVDVTDVPPALTVEKTAAPTTVPETAPGATETITYTVTITNDSVETVTITAVEDAVEGAPAAPVAGTCDDLVGTTLAAGASTSCTFTAPVSGDAGDTVDDVATVRATDDEANVATASDAASVTFTDVGSSIAVDKTADVGSVPEPGGPVTYTVDITNTSTTDSVTITSITDSVDGDTPFPVQGTCDDLVGTSLAPGASASCEFTMAVSGDPGDTVGDTVVVEGVDDDADPVSDDGSEVVDVVDVESSLLVSKVADVESVAEPGDDVTYTVTITNTSDTDDVTIDSITDVVGAAPAVPVAGTCDDLVGTTLTPGQVVTCTFTVPVEGNAGDSVRDTVTVTGTDDDDGPVEGTGSETVDVTDVLPSITVTKTASPSTVAETGPGVTRTITYTVTILNDSPETVTIGSIVDSVGGAPAAPVAGTCDDLVGTQLAAQAGTSCTFTAPVAGDAGATTTDLVTVTATDDEQNQATDDDDATVTFTDVDSSLLVTKTADVGSVPEPGADVTYTVTITNTSPADTVVIGSITDSVDGAPAAPAGGSCAALVGTSLAPGADVTCTFTKAVSGDAGDTVGDTVVVSGTDDDQEPVSDEASESVDVTNVASSLLVTKVADVASVPEPGGDVTYTVTITNTSTADSVTIDSITDSVGGGPAVDVAGSCDDLIGQTLAPSASTSCTFTMAVAGDAGDVVGDTVVVGGTDDDDEPVTGQASEAVDVTDVDSALAVTKVADVASVPEPGGDVTYTVTITNTSTADSVTIDSITDSVGGGPAVDVAGSCDDLIGQTLAPSASVNCTFTMAVAGDAGDVVGDTVVVGGTDDDDEPVTGQASETVDVTDVPPTGTVTKVADPASVAESGGTVTFTVTVTNTSSAEAATVTAITDEVGGEVYDVTAVAGPITATTCATGTVLDPGGVYSCSFDYQVPPGTEGDLVVDTISATLTDDEENDTTPTDTEEVPLTDVAPSITVAKDNDPDQVAAPGSEVEFSVTVTNTSWESVTITSLTDSVDGGDPFDITTVADPVTATTCGTGVVVPAGDSYSCTFTLRVTSDEAVVVPDEVVATVEDDDGTAATASDTAVTTVSAVADLAVEKVLMGEGLVEGEQGTYELRVTNLGPSTAVGVTVVDALPAGLTPVSAAGTGWTCTVTGDEVTCTRAELGPGETATVTLVVQAAAGSAGTSVTNVVDVEATTDDPDTANNHDEVTTEVAAAAPAAIDNPPPSTVGELVRTGTSLPGLFVTGLLLALLGTALRLFGRRRRSPAS